MSLGLAFPGRPVITQFASDGPGRFVIDVPNPGEISDFCVFLTSPLPDNEHGISVYYGLAGWQFIGALSNTKPTIIVNPGWALNPEINSLPLVRVALVYETPTEILPKLAVVEQSDFRKVFAKKVALNLVHFLQSFGGVPLQAIDKWFAKFEEKFKRDPNFVLKGE